MLGDRLKFLQSRIVKICKLKLWITKADWQSWIRKKPKYSERKLEIKQWLSDNPIYWWDLCKTTHFESRSRIHTVWTNNCSLDNLVSRRTHLFLTTKGFAVLWNFHFLTERNKTCLKTIPLKQYINNTDDYFSKMCIWFSKQMLGKNVFEKMWKKVFCLLKLPAVIWAYFC